MCVAKSLRKAKSRLPLRGRCHAFGMTERASPAAPAAHVRYSLDEHERSELPQARIAWGATPAN